METFDASKVFGYGVAAISFICGVLIMIGVFTVDREPVVRNTFGVVLILMGLYRFVVTHYKPKPSKWRRFTNTDEE